MYLHQKIKKLPFWVLSLAGFVVFIIFNLFMNVPERISHGEKGQLAIQLLDEMRRPILAIKNTNHTNMNHKMKYETFKKHEILALKLITEYLISASYNPKLLNTVKQLSVLMDKWLQIENKFWQTHLSRQNNATIKDEQTKNHHIDDNSYVIFFHVLDVLALGEEPVHHDIDEGRAASAIFKLSAAVLTIYMFIIIIIFQRVRHNELVKSNNKIFENLSESYKALEQRTIELENAKKFAEDANKSKSEFLSNMSHELRTPMHAILAFAELGKTKIKTTKIEKVEQYFSRILDGGTRLMTLLNSLLDLSKLEAGKMEMNFSESDLRDVITASIKEAEANLNQEGLTIVIEDNDCDSKAIFDPEQILQVINNLLSNAVKFSPQGSQIKIKIENDTFVKHDTNEDETLNQAIRFSIIDQGVGIPNDELGLVFDKFSQSTTTKTGAGGTGLGLSISKEIILAHSGRIWAENNKPEKGSVLKFVIPRKQKKEK